MRWRRASLQDPGDHDSGGNALEHAYQELSPDCRLAHLVCLTNHRASCLHCSSSTKYSATNNRVLEEGVLEIEEDVKAIIEPFVDYGKHAQHRERLGRVKMARLAIGSVLAVATPFVHSKWASFLRIQSEVEVVKDAVQAVAEVVEEAATLTEKVSSEIVEQLPEGGRLRPVAVLLEHASKQVAEEAHLAKDIIHKVDEIEEDVKAIIEPFVDHGKHAKEKAQQQRSKNV
ncbi:hypothetical protein PR202_gb07824 [Eleusine coracana subsp. coracana]|uniref:Uncharacterized protein n=1 Tax=Eleusine coracana subsp. coracana TaxID=191504 RepID=A0AAV5ED71_ELECO|nr:hypothetical protein PR202_gb07824 [Eleusine coracana subsp. coracana]